MSDRPNHKRQRQEPTAETVIDHRPNRKRQRQESTARIVIDYIRPKRDIIGMVSYRPAEQSIFDGETLNTLLNLRLISRTKRDQVDRYLRAKYRKWDLEKNGKLTMQDFLREVGRFVFFGFVPEKTIEEQIEDSNDKIRLLELESKEEAAEDDAEFFTSKHQDTEIYLTTHGGDGVVPVDAFTNWDIQDNGQIIEQGNDLSKVWIDQVTIIGDRAFMGCEKLAKVRLPPTLETIGKDAFSYCKQLQTIRFPKSVETFEEGCFADTGLQSVEFPESDKNLIIRAKAFYQCFIKKVVFPNRNLVIQEEITDRNQISYYNRGCEAFQGNEITHIKFSPYLNPSQLTISEDVFEGNPIEIVECPYSCYETLKRCFLYKNSNYISKPKKIEFIFYEVDKPNISLIP